MATEDKETLPIYVEEVLERQRSSTLIAALNRDAECDDETNDLHIASQPSSLLYRYIVSPDVQYAGGRSQSRSSIFQPLSTLCTHQSKEQKGICSRIDSHTTGISGEVEYLIGSQYLDDETQTQHHNVESEPPVSSIQRTNSFDDVSIQPERRWRFGLVVASLGRSTKLLYVEPG